MVARKLTDNQFLYTYLHAKYGLTCTDIAKTFGEHRSFVSRTVNRTKKVELRNGKIIDFQKIFFGQPPKITIARTERHCPHCSARPGPKLSMNINEERTDFDMFRDKSGAICHSCGWSF